MGYFRFRRSIELFGGLKMNINKKSVSFSFGTKGYHVTYGTRGTYVSMGIPGSGLSYTSFIPNKPKNFCIGCNRVIRTEDLYCKRCQNLKIKYGTTNKVMIEWKKQQYITAKNEATICFHCGCKMNTYHEYCPECNNYIPLTSAHYDYADINPKYKESIEKFLSKKARQDNLRLEKMLSKRGRTNYNRYHQSLSAKENVHNTLENSHVQAKVTPQYYINKELIDSYYYKYTACPFCGEKVQYNAYACPSCNYPVRLWLQDFSQEDIELLKYQLYALATEQNSDIKLEL